MADNTPEDTLVSIAMMCMMAVIEGRPTVSISATGKKLTGFPRGELLSVGTNGARNIAVDPVKVMAWIHKGTMARETRRLTPTTTTKG